MNRKSSRGDTPEPEQPRRDGDGRTERPTGLSGPARPSRPTRPVGLYRPGPSGHPSAGAGTPATPTRGPRAWLGLAGWLALTFVAAYIGSRFEPGTWYARLERPDWAPPDAVFGPVWTALYILMGTAAWLVWREHGFRNARAALVVYIGQLALNAAWSWLFFGLHDIRAALACIVVLWFAIIATLVLFARKHRVAAWLLVPYLLWVTFATALNAAFYGLNP